MADDEKPYVWYVDESNPEEPFGWNDDGDIFAVYKKGGQWRAVTTRRRLWWERWIKDWLIGISGLAALIGWASIVGSLRVNGHTCWATFIGTAPAVFGCGYWYAKTH